jgi:hypothetical protein
MRLFKTLHQKKQASESIRLVNILLGVAYIIEAIIIVVLANSAKGSQPINLGFLGRDKVSSDIASHAVNSPASHLLFDLNVAYLVGAFLVTGALIALLSSTRYRKNYDTSLINGASRTRWLYFSLVGGLLVSTVALLSGTFDLLELLMIFALFAVVGKAGPFWGAAPKPKLSFIPGLIILLIPLTVIVANMLGAHVYGNGLPSYVYGIIAITISYIILVILNSYLQRKKVGHWEDYYFSEKAFVLVSFLAVSSVAWMIFAFTLS